LVSLKKLLQLTGKLIISYSGWSPLLASHCQTKLPSPRHDEHPKNDVDSRVAKCNGFGGLIRVKLFASWGKKFGRICNLAKSSLFGMIYASFCVKNSPM